MSKQGLFENQTLYFKKGVVTLVKIDKQAHPIVWAWVVSHYSEIAEKYKKINSNSKLFAKSVQFYLNQESFDKVQSELKLNANQNSIRFGFASDQILFCINNPKQHELDKELKKTYGL